MILIYMIITPPAIIAVAQGSLICNLTEPGAQMCFGFLGEPLIFYLPTIPHTRTSLTKNKDVILRLKNNSLINMNENFKNRTFLGNGIFNLTKATKNDSGEYTMEQYNSTDGVLLHTVNIYLDILDHLTVSCSSEQYDLEFIFSLDANMLIQTRAKTPEKQSVSNATMSLHGQLMGKLMCMIVQSNFSREQTVIHLTGCSGTKSPLCIVTVAVVGGVAILLILAMFFGTRHFKKTTDIMTVNEDDAEDDIIYSDVKVKQRTRKATPRSNQDAS
ncbi:unnamed protein product [Oreochromis niloticus]|nr:unnamed protein product [Mustela putorius furo]